MLTVKSVHFAQLRIVSENWGEKNVIKRSLTCICVEICPTILKGQTSQLQQRIGRN